MPMSEAQARAYAARLRREPAARASLPHVGVTAVPNRQLGDPLRRGDGNWVVLVSGHVVRDELSPDTLSRHPVTVGGTVEPLIYPPADVPAARRPPTRRPRDSPDQGS